MLVWGTGGSPLPTPPDGTRVAHRLRETGPAIAPIPVYNSHEPSDQGLGSARRDGHDREWANAQGEKKKNGIPEPREQGPVLRHACPKRMKSGI